jgi:hypothetical protein
MARQPKDSHLHTRRRENLKSHEIALDNNLQLGYKLIKVLTTAAIGDFKVFLFV